MDEIIAPELPEAEWLSVLARAADVVASGGGQELDQLVPDAAPEAGDDGAAIDATHLPEPSSLEEPFPGATGEHLDEWEAGPTDAGHGAVDGDLTDLDLG